MTEGWKRENRMSIYGSRSQYCKFHHDDMIASKIADLPFLIIWFQSP